MANKRRRKARSELMPQRVPRARTSLRRLVAAAPIRAGLTRPAFPEFLSERREGPTSPLVLRADQSAGARSRSLGATGRLSPNRRPTSLINRHVVAPRIANQPLVVPSLWAMATMAAPTRAGIA